MYFYVGPCDGEKLQRAEEKRATREKNEPHCIIASSGCIEREREREKEKEQSKRTFSDEKLPLNR